MLMSKNNKMDSPSLERLLKKVNALCAELKVFGEPGGHLLNYFIVQQENYFIIIYNDYIVTHLSSIFFTISLMIASSSAAES
jgi:hypothetical protein